MSLSTSWRRPIGAGGAEQGPVDASAIATAAVDGGAAPTVPASSAPAFGAPVGRDLFGDPPRASALRVRTGGARGGLAPWRTRVAGHGLQGSLPRDVYARLLELTDTRTLRDAEDARARVEQIARHLVAADDPRGLFAVVYRLITNRACQSVADGAYEHEDWAQRLIVRFATRYLDNLAGDLRGDTVTPAWQEYYARARDPAASRVETLGLGILVHLVDDLPRTLAEIGSTRAQEQDFMTFGEILLQVFPDLVRDVQSGYGADAQPLLSGLALGAAVDGAFGKETTTRTLYQAIRWKAWMMGQKLQHPLERPLARLEVSMSFATMRGALGGLAAAGSI